MSQSTENITKSQSTNYFAALVDIFVEPKSALNYAAQKPGSLWPTWLLISLVTMAMFFLFYYQLDLDFYNQKVVADHVLAHGQQPDEELLSFLLLEERFDWQAWLVLAMVPIGILVGALLYALYLFLVSLAMSEQKINYGTWLSIAIWCSMPSIVDSLIGMLRIMQFGGQLDTSMMMVSLQTFVQLPADHLMQTVLTGITISSLWGLVLGFIAVKQRLNCYAISATVIVVIPTLVVLSIAPLFKLIF